MIEEHEIKVRLDKYFFYCTSRQIPFTPRAPILQGDQEVNSPQ